MEFGKRATASTLGAIVGLAIAVLLAYWGYSFWALIWSSVGSSISSSIVLAFLSSFRPGLPDFGADIRRMVAFGANVTLFDLVNYFHRNLDNVLIGKVWGDEPLGYYSRAYALLMLPIQRIRGPLNTVAFPALSRLHGQPEEYRKYFRRLVSAVAYGSMPLTAFLFVASRPLVEIALGPGWSGVVPLFAVLAIAGFIQPVGSLRAW